MTALALSRHRPPLRRRLVLLVENDSEQAELIARALQLAGFEVMVVGSSAAARVAARQGPSVIVLKTALPDGSGLDLAVELRASGGAVGLLFVTDGDSLEDRLNGFAVGADDVVPRPLKVAELVARVGALHRRMSSHQVAIPEPDDDGASRLTVKDFVLDLSRHELTRDGHGFGLTTTEFKVLRQLMSSVDKVVTKDDLVLGVWGDEIPRSMNSAEKFVSQVRRKLSAAGDPLIETVRGIGYIVRSV
ncbi:putative two component transcriptional regulatory protein [Kineosporia sp. NBRC 101677]|uniref:response regulator transcription factor n=1 Tax=Kineosporia sp. NBRC 101677 TaxID=3032197 RepID=UPI0024A406C8|nr:response regulator transcription factor [Kineosporia sp. NBRC 101677]GLY18030.1 putative two component transcriptional regulatory protein [Kineosporia sp. NBRC 101677]